MSYLTEVIMTREEFIASITKKAGQTGWKEDIREYLMSHPEAPVDEIILATREDLDPEQENVKKNFASQLHALRRDDKMPMHIVTENKVVKLKAYWDPESEAVIEL
jgi:hypothetical protein